MSFCKTLVVFLSLLTIIPSATTKDANATTTTKDINNVDPECLNYMITSGGETICLDSESPVEPDPSPVEPSVNLECSPEPTTETEPSSEPTAEMDAPAESVAEAESSAEPVAEVASAPESATEESSPELLADAAECSPDSSGEESVPPSP